MEKQHICPWWLGYTFLIPIRKYQHDPYKILGPHIKQGMTVMDYGCAMGYFSIPLAKMTGTKGTVYCVDIQEKMLVKLKKRAIRLGVSPIIKTLQVGKNYNPSELKDKLDFVLLFMVAHEVPDQATLFKDLFAMLKPGGKILFFEP
jgi:2-polyprenyl-3-methyl-5-hydroxy-6-metoxy-1,4-benzoquinol methylase